ncbi:pseudouridine synthase [Glaciecola petra]|uniref:Dual-specificity RNA pseudouridine synthase RluA n=1 Tax=Glaciecola petra TaxID=3075602 RepID=A0ABU2ZSY1_9ALTE|nr:pseudouridine synthase [Aestuariibacter sp. P117]MDT0595419.1 pseudouridine synthase [Aestuariibacter sp. P117]
MVLLNYAPEINPAFELLYGDDDVLVFNKAAGLLSVPGKAIEHKDSLERRVQRVWPSATIVHRLDMATSGLMLMALNKESHRHISKQFELRQISKTYYARVYGKPVSSEGSVKLPLICDWPNRPKQMVDLVNGKRALTHWQCVSSKQDSSLMKLTPVTGRSHQLRVHMHAIGHPILGDRLYAHPAALAASERLCLHAAHIAFEHPTKHSAMEFSSPFTF